jgi:NAD(P)-dependent dehydrogenase (short-subunit alcohol dehydrogenase family)
MKPPGVVVITGGDAGVGRAAARRFAREGWRVGLIARDVAALKDTGEELRALGGTSHGVSADVADAQAIASAADEIAQALGPIQVWVNNAMVTVFSPLWRMSPEEFARVTAVTYLGCVHGTLAALSHMRPRNRGHIVQVGSALAYRGIPLQSAYCGAKHAIRGFTASLRAELLHEKSAVALSIVELPAINTPQFDWARTHMAYTPQPAGGAVYEPETAADAIYHAVQNPRPEYWLGGVTAQIILGNMAAPNVMDHMIKGTYDTQQTDAPVPPTGAHRVSGSFGRGARQSGWLISGLTARLAAIGAGALTCMVLGGLAVSALHGKRPH